MKSKTYRVIVLNPDYTLAYVGLSSSKSGAESQAWTWEQRVDSEGRKMYMVYVARKYEPGRVSLGKTR